MKAQNIKNIIYEELQIPQQIKVGVMTVKLNDLEKIVDEIGNRLETLGCSEGIPQPGDGADTYAVALIFNRSTGASSVHYAHRLKIVKATDEDSAIMVAIIDLWRDALKEYQLFMKPIAIKIAPASL